MIKTMSPQGFVRIWANHYVVSVDGSNRKIPVRENLRESAIAMFLYTKHVVLIVAKDANDQMLKVFRVASERKNGDYIHQLDYSSYGFKKINNNWHDPNDPVSADFVKNRFGFLMQLKFYFCLIF